MPTTTTSIRDLPFELIEHILDLAAGTADLESKASIASRNSFLREAAFICRDFRYPAQSCLWKILRVHTPETARKLLSSKSLKCFATTELSVEGVHSGSDGLSGSTAARVLGKVIGVRTLRLMDFGRLSLRVLQNENLSTLRTLYLMSSFPDKSTTVDALTFPFHLRTLHLFNRAYSSNLLPTLFSQCSTTLTSLTLITSHSSPSYPSLVKAFPSVAPNLRHLSLQHRPSPALIDSLPLCTRLTNLECSFAVDLGSTLDSLSNARLKTLSIELDYNLVDIAQVLLLRLDSSTLDRLELLKIPRAPAKEEFGEFGGQGLLERCQEKGIEVKLGQVVAWRTRSVFD
ncbi:uncharacterized protein JCM6883_000272 [Sporobolomyces salmoneus]|uniref:uncharacterized protein n=1 Tax=Sporobolomyces salmoneus TaxID=183962 RepID=UPI0031775814